ncbi:MAG TPA: SGNH/GDSL hydrolase family protein [Steroidobacteraceae bacterium]
MSPRKSLLSVASVRLARSLAFGFVLLGAHVAFAFDEHGGDWVATWGASPQSEIEPVIGPPPAPVQFNNQTVRMVARISKGGSRIRVRLDNAFGTDSVVIGGAHVALHASGAGVIPGSDHQLTFGGNATITIPPGAPIVSDPVDFDVRNLTELAVSIYLPQPTAGLSGHSLGVQTTYVTAPGSGDQAGAVTVPAPTTTLVRYFLAGIDVLADDAVAAVVTFGDSITDGLNSTVDANRRWPDRLAERLLERRHPQDLTVVNEGISGNRLLHNVIGPDALSRFDRDVISQAHVEFVIVLLGINDVGFSAITVPNSPPPFGNQSVTSDQMIQAYRQMIARAHTQGVKIIGATLTPFEGAGYATPEGEAKRQAANRFIRSSSEFDAVIDFDRATRDPTHPTRLAPQLDSGDHLHPNDLGYKAMADSIDLAIFQRRR